MDSSFSKHSFRCFVLRCFSCCCFSLFDRAKAVTFPTDSCCRLSPPLRRRSCMGMLIAGASEGETRDFPRFTETSCSASLSLLLSICLLFPPLYVYPSVGLHLCRCLPVCLSVYPCLCLCICICPCIRARACVCVYIHACARKCVFVRVYLYIYLYISARVRPFPYASG